jgi:hypothetical protein
MALVQALRATVVDEAADPVSINGDRRRLDASVTLPHTPHLRKTIRIQAPRNPQHGCYPQLAPMPVHRDSNAESSDRMTTTIDEVCDIIWSEMIERQANA